MVNVISLNRHDGEDPLFDTFLDECKKNAHNKSGVLRLMIQEWLSKKGHRFRFGVMAVNPGLFATVAIRSIPVWNLQPVP